MKIDFPKNLISSQGGIEFLCFVWRMMKKQRNGTILWNFKYTRKVETNLLSFLGLILNRSINHHNRVILISRDEFGKECKYSNDILNVLFNKYSDLKSDAISYNYMNLNDEDIDLKKDVLYSSIFNLNLKNYTEIKVLISEFIANIKMHTDLKECAISGYLDIKNEMIIFSICNMGKTIRQEIKECGNIEFDNDIEAILWALKKTNTTRKDDESGGLGLYLLRKYLNSINGMGEIVSGRSIVRLKKGFYDKDDVNNIILDEEDKIKFKNSFFPGTLITIKVPYILNNEKKDGQIESLRSFALN